MADNKTSTRSIATTKRAVVLKERAAASALGGFMDFVREQGVVGLAVGLVLGTQVKAVVDQIVKSFIDPLLKLILPGSGGLMEKTFSWTLFGKTADFGYGAFISVMISFLSIAAIVYFAVKGLGLDKLDKKKA